MDAHVGFDPDNEAVPYGYRLVEPGEMLEPQDLHWNASSSKTVWVRWWRIDPAKVGNSVQQGWRCARRVVEPRGIAQVVCGS